MLRAQITYDSPYGGESLRKKDVVAAAASVDRFLSRCTDSSEPDEVKLRIFEEQTEEIFRGSHDLRRALPGFDLAKTSYRPGPLVDEATALLGPGHHEVWCSGASGNCYLWEWTGKARRSNFAERRRAFFDFLVAHQSLPRIHTAWRKTQTEKPTCPQVQLTLWHSFRFTEPGGCALLPFQEPQYYLEHWQDSSHMVVNLGGNSINLGARLPFEEPDRSFLAYHDEMVVALDHKLSLQRLRLWTPPRRGKKYLKRQIQLPEP